MQMYQGIILGVIQGLTEFLPVSSSGHLVLGQIYFNITENGFVFDASVHMGTLFAILIVYFRDIAEILKSLAHYAVTRDSTGHETNLTLAAAIVAGSVPTAMIGFTLKQFEAVLFSSSLLVGMMLIVTGCLLWVSRRYDRRGEPGQRPDEQGNEPLTLSRAAIIGIVQGFAVIPGISRSGATIATGLFTGLERKRAARFSFLLSIPAILGAQILSLKDVAESGGQIDPATICGTIASFVVGLAALKLLLKLVDTGKFHLFSPYCWLVGTVVILSGVI